MNLQTVAATPAPATPVRALGRLLDEIEALLIGIDPGVYRARFAPSVSGSIGEHVRHCLDHVSSLLASDPSATLSYDRRHRGTAIEADPDAAVSRILESRRALELWAARSLDEPIRVSSVIDATGEAVTGWSTTGRELAFVLNHTIHHQALIAILLAVYGHTVPDRFGHSPSTPRRH